MPSREVSDDMLQHCIEYHPTPAGDVLPNDTPGKNVEIKGIEFNKSKYRASDGSVFDISFVNKVVRLGK